MIRLLLLACLVACSSGDKNGEETIDETTDTTSSDGSDATETSSNTMTETEAEEYPTTLPEKCELWCELMDENCPTYAIHPHDGCLSYCNNTLAPLQNGSEGDMSVNTIDCRISHVLQAAGSTDPTMECEAASFGGGGVCGGYCENYCGDIFASCTASNPDFSGQPSYTSQDECMQACNAEFTGTPIVGIPLPIQNFGYGNTVYCRQYHLKVAHMTAAEDPAAVYAMHCPHASRQSTTDTCSDSSRPNTANYCSFATTFCSGSEPHDIFPEGTGVGDCMELVNPLVANGVYAEAPFPSFANDAGNSLGCLNYWMYESSLDAASCAKGHYDPDEWLINGGTGVCHP